MCPYFAGRQEGLICQPLGKLICLVQERATKEHGLGIKNERGSSIQGGKM
jgi:hypothetical protein